MATALYKVESKITAEALQKQYPTAIIEIVENVSDKVSIQIRSKRGIITTPRPIPTGPIEDPSRIQRSLRREIRYSSDSSAKL